MEIFPHTLIRTAGLTIELICPNSQSIKLKEEIEKFLLEKANLEFLKKKVEKRLFLLIGSTKDEYLRKQILNLKRDLFNSKPQKRNNSYLQIDILVNGQLTDYYNEVGRHHDFLGKITSEYKTVIEDERINLKYVFEKYELRNGLLLSSLDMFNSLGNYDLKKKQTKRFYQVEKGMLKYATRVCTKTSPFSTFTTIGLCEFNNAKKLNHLTAREADCRDGVQYKIRLNSFVFRHIIICLKINRNFRKSLTLVLNTSIIKMENFYYYLINDNNIEIFQRLNYNKIVNLIYNTLIDKNETYDDILKLIKSETGEVENKIDDYLLKLIQNGFLEIGIGVSELDDLWDIKLRDFLKSNKLLELEIIQKITKLIEFKGQYEKIMLVERRKEILENIYKMYIEIINYSIAFSDFEFSRVNEERVIIFYKNNDTGGKIAKFGFQELTIESILYEDVRKDLTINFSYEEIKKNITVLNEFIKGVSIFKYVNSESFDLINFFKARYDNKTISLMQFYEEYFIYKNERTKAISNDVFSVPSDYLSTFAQKDSIRKNRETWANAFETSWKNKTENNSETVSLTINKLKEIGGVLDIPNFDFLNSFSSLIHFYIEKKPGAENRLMFVLDTIGPGYGRIFARFSRLFKDNILKEIKDFNLKLKKEDEIFVENSDSSPYNLNMHPPILDKEIRVPGGANNFDKSLQVDISWLSVRFDGKRQKLQLFDLKANKEIFVFDMTVQTLDSRANLYNFLTLFSKGETISNQQYLQYMNRYIEYNIDSPPPCTGKIKVLPRVIIEHCIVVQRKRWILDKNCIPMKISSFLSETEIFILYNGWRKKIGLPDEIFVRINIRGGVQLSEKADYKPQYINFNSPLLVNFLDKLLCRTGEHIVIEEMLPNSNDLVEVDGKRKITELLIQWNSYDGN